LVFPVDVPSSSKSEGDGGEPDPKRAKLDEKVQEECEGWDTWGEEEHRAYTLIPRSIEDKTPYVIAYFEYLDEHVRKNKGFDITARCPVPEITDFYLVLPLDAPTPEELKEIHDFPRVDPRGYDVVLQLVNALAKCAVDVQNEEKGSELEFIKVLKSYQIVHFGYYFYITLVALDKRTGEYRKCQTRVFASIYMRGSHVPYGVCSFWVRGKVDAAGAAKPDCSKLWPSDWELIRLKEDKMPRVPKGVRHHSPT